MYTDVMQSLSDDERKQVFGEVLMDEFKAIREGIAGLPTRQEFKRLEEKVDGLGTDMKIVKTAVTDLSRLETEDKRRIMALENAT
jgi:hypothetical protein